MKGSAAAKKKVCFTLEAPNAQSVLLAGCFTNWSDDARPLKRQKTGAWKTNVSLAPGTYRYRFLVDGQWTDDPACTMRESNPFGAENCLITVV